MRLPVRFAGALALSESFTAASARPGTAAGASGGLVPSRPNEITRIDPTTAQTTEAAPQPFGYESDLSCFGYIGPPGEGFIAQIVGAENICRADRLHDKATSSTWMPAHDRGIKVGRRVLDRHARGGRRPPHQTGNRWASSTSIGAGSSVVCVEGRTATVRVVFACTDIPMDSFLKPFEPIPIPLGRRMPSAVACDPPSGKAKGRIVYSRDGVVAIGSDMNVLIDLGLAEGVEPGDQLTIFRYAPGPTTGSVPRAPTGSTRLRPRGSRSRGRISGRSPFSTWGIGGRSGRVIDSSRLIEIGDEVELK